MPVDFSTGRSRVVHMSEETNERYVIEVGILKVFIRDIVADRTVAEFEGPQRLLAATAELNRLNAMELQPEPEITPAEFLAETLPVKARRQRLEAHLREVREIEESLFALLAVDAANLKRVIVLREKLEKELASPSSATVAAQNGLEVVADTPSVPERSEALVRAAESAWRAQSKPRPY